MLFFKRENKEKVNEVSEVNRQITIAHFCEKFCVPVPPAVSDIADEPKPMVCMGAMIDRGCIYLMLLDRFSPAGRARKADENGAAIIFMDKKHEEALNPEDYKTPIVFVEDLVEKSTEVYREIRRSFGVKTVAITGSIGKTTTKDFLRHALGMKYNLYFSKKNKNSAKAVARTIATKLSDEHEVYVQEVGAGTPGLVRLSARMLEADVFVLTNVHEHHINEYLTYENILEDKLSIQDYMPEDGVIVANFDDEGIAKAEFKRRVVSVGIETDYPVDYRGINIVQNNEFMEMDIQFGENLQHVRLKTIGLHNAYNVLQSFAAARELGVPDELAVKGIEKYRSNGIRQNLSNVGGYKLYMDCYNVCAASIEGGIKTVEEFRLKEGAKKIAILGGENKLGNEVSELTYQLGLKLADSGVDHILCFGSEGEDMESLNTYGDGRALCRGLQAGGFDHAEFFWDRKKLVDRLHEIAHPGDLIFFKGVWYLDMAQVADAAFGSAFAFNFTFYKANCQWISDEHFSARLIQNLDGLELAEFDGGGMSKVTVPDQIDGHPVFRLTDKLFAGNQDLTEVNLGNSLVTIGREAFAGCSNLEKIVIPPSVKVIFKGAFCDCTSLKEVVLHEGLTHIGPGAFRGCPNLQEVAIPKSVGYLAQSAFDPKENADG